MADITSVKGLEALINKKTKSLRQDIDKLKLELEELKQLLNVPTIVETVKELPWWKQLWI